MSVSAYGDTSYPFLEEYFCVSLRRSLQLDLWEPISIPDPGMWNLNQPIYFRIGMGTLKTAVLGGTKDISRAIPCESWTRKINSRWAIILFRKCNLYREDLEFYEASFCDANFSSHWNAFVGQIPQSKIYFTIHYFLENIVIAFCYIWEHKD